MNPSGLRNLATALSQTRDAPLSGSHHRADPIRLSGDVELSVGLRHPRRRHRKLCKAIKPTQCTPLKPTLRLEPPSLASDPNWVPLRRESSDHGTRTLTSD
jgi:hypothetical protein